MDTNKCVKLDERPLELGWLWNTPDRWAFHVTSKRVIWNMLEQNNGELDFKLLYKLLEVKESWLDIKPEYKVAPNYPLIKFIRDRYMDNYRKMKPPLKYRLGINKVGILLCTLYKEDTAYIGRIGGSIQYILDNHEDWIAAKTKEDRLLLLEDLYNWWKENDWRKRTYQLIDRIFKWVLKHYDEEPFIEASVNFVIYLLIANKDKWNRCDGKIFEPENWYPRGSGTINYIVHNRVN